MRVIVADDRREVREAMRLLFEQEHIELVCEAAGVDALLAGVARTPADLLLFDWDLSGASGPELVRAVRAIAADAEGHRHERPAGSPGPRVGRRCRRIREQGGPARAIAAGDGRGRGCGAPGGGERRGGMMRTPAQRLPQEAAGIPDHLRHHHRGVRAGGDGQHGREDQPAGQRRHPVLRRQGDRRGRLGLVDELLDADAGEQDRRDREGRRRAGGIGRASPCCSTKDAVDDQHGHARHDHRQRPARARSTSRSRSPTRRAGRCGSEDRGKVVVGSDIAKKLRAEVGKTVMLRGVPFEVVGIMDKTLTAPDNSAMISLPDAQALFIKDLPEVVQKQVQASIIATGITVYTEEGRRSRRAGQDHRDSRCPGVQGRRVPRPSRRRWPTAPRSSTRSSSGWP